MVSEIIRPGDKIDINFLHQNNGKTYKSSVFDFLDSYTLEIGMPTEGGKMVIFNLGFECQLYFYTSKGLYTCEAVVVQRYKKGNFFLLAMRMKTGLKKFQRREFYRLECLIDFSYYRISKEVAQLGSENEFLKLTLSPEYIIEQKFACTRDISGGGIRFTAKEEIEIGQLILIVIRLNNEKIDHTFYLVADVISCELAPQTESRWIVRAKFRHKDPKIRDTIVRYVFEQDRKLRKKENG